MKQFYIGQKVICVDNKPINNTIYNASLKNLIIGKTYTVEYLDEFGILLKEVRSSNPSGMYQIGNRFKPLQEAKLQVISYSKVLEEVLVSSN